jgi:biotin carboxyl carrier protein
MDLEFRDQHGTMHNFTLDSGPGQVFSLTVDGEQLSGNWLRACPNTISLLGNDGSAHLIHLARDESGLFHLQHQGRIYRLADPADDDQRSGGSGRVDTGGDINEQGDILSPMPGKVVGLPVAVGDTVAAGDLLVILESMKMENPVLSPVNGTVHSLPLAVGDAAALGDPLIRLNVKEEDDE